jgi:pyrimidine-nucleoside phosphorylase
MRTVEILRKKRDGYELTREEIGFLVSGYTHDEIPDYQMSAWLMSVVLRGMNRAETAALTEAMLFSGQVLDLSALPGRKVDKHSTGGVGDKTSLIIAPIVAAGGVIVPMISGRGLAHTGGTLDKLESIPGFNVNLSLVDFQKVLQACGCSLIGQTEEIAPADKRLYALRDVTCTVDSPPLICGSIMSKKLAEGIDALVLDVKTGSGAFMKNEESAIELAELLVETGCRMGTRTVALITDMNQPLGRKVGNALEIAECIEVLKGEGPEDLIDLCLELSGWMLHLGEKTSTVAEGKKLAREILDDGRGLEKFREMIRLQGGDPAVIDDPNRLPHTRETRPVTSPAAGYVAEIDCEQVGVSSLLLGGGRERKDGVIDPAVGIVMHKKVGDVVEEGEPLMTVHYNSVARLEEACLLLGQSYRLNNEGKPNKPPLVHRLIEGQLHSSPTRPTAQPGDHTRR